MSEELQPQAETAGTPVEKQETAPESKKYKVKVDGVESEVDENELLTSYQKGRSADKKFQEAAELRKQLEAFVENVKANPNELLTQLGHNPKEWAKQLLLAEIEDEANAADPNLRRVAELEKKLTALEEGDKKKKLAEAEAQSRIEEEAIVNKIDSEIANAFKEMGITKPTAELVADVAEQMLAQYKLDKKPLDSKEALSRAKNSYSNRIKAITNGAPEALLEMLPQEYLDKIAEVYLSKRKPTSVPNLKSSTPATSSGEKEVNKSLNDFFKRKS